MKKWLVAVCAFMLMGAVSYGAKAWVNAQVVNISPQGTELVLQYRVGGVAPTRNALLGSASDTLWQNRALAVVLTAISTERRINMHVDTAVDYDRVTQISLFGL